MDNMQRNEKESIETRSFPEIYKSLTDYEKSKLLAEFVKSSCLGTNQTFWSWGTGKTKPNHPLVIEKVADVLGKFLGKKVLPKTLFI